MGQTNSTQRELETRGSYNEPIARFDEFGRITNFYHDGFNRLRPGRDPNPRRAYWEKGELYGPPFPHFKQLVYNPLENSKPDLGMALEGAYINVGQNLEDTFKEFGNSF